VPDDLDARLVVLSIDYPYSKDPDSPAETAARVIYETRGNVPRLYRNTLVFLAVDRTRLQDLADAASRYLAWESILGDKETLNLSLHQVRQAEAQRATADSTVAARLPEAYQWLLVLLQNSPQAAVDWQAIRLSGSDALAVRAGKKLRNDELLVTALAGSRLRMELDRVPLWRGDHVAVKQLVEDFARYLYLPRLKSPAVLVGAIRDGLGLLTWQADSFAYADSCDEAAARYVGLRGGQLVTLSADGGAGLLVKPDVAARQIKAETAAQTSQGKDKSGDAGETTDTGGETETEAKGTESGPAAPRRYHGSVTLDPVRVGRDASRIADEVIAHLAGLVDADVTVTLEIEARMPSGAPDQVVRTVTENCRTLKFTTHGFETE
jgi:hypothetical protein